MQPSGIDVLVTRLVLDTSAYSHLRRGREEVIDAVARADTVYLPATVLGELEAGFRLGNRHRENRRSLGAFLDEPFVEIITTDSEVALRYGEIFFQLRDAGTPIPVNDIWIAAAVVASGANLLTFDADFDRVPGLSHTCLDA